MTCNDERGKEGPFVDAGDPTLPVRYTNGVEFVGATQVDNTNSEQASGLVSGSSIFRKSHSPESSSPIVIPKKHKISHNRNLPGSDTVFHNKADDLHSPIIECGTTTMPFLKASNQCTSPIPWVEPDRFTPLAQTQQWVYDNTHYGQPDYMSGIFTLQDSAYSTGNGLNHGISTEDMAKKTKSMAAFETDIIEDSPFDKEEMYICRSQITLFCLLIFIDSVTM